MPPDQPPFNIAGGDPAVTRARQLAEWMHESFGHADAEDLESFASLADRYDTRRFDIRADKNIEIDRQVRVAIDRLIEPER
jgi:hypothetical protein